MTILDLIEKKKHKEELTRDEIKWVIDSYVNDEVKDYQMSALAMAIYFNGMSDAETGALTNAMTHSGDVIDLSNINGIKIDKHSTGGVGDKVTLIVSPIIASFGVPVAKMSGRGLGITGGTVDKLESIPGYQVEITIDKFIEQVNDIGISVVGQTQALVPADKKLYALRDVTATVDSIPLIASSIMSKKIATGADAILLDVKCGDGAFMKNEEQATELAKAMVGIGNELKRDVRVEITNMDKPLGRAVGNKIEIIEAIDVLSGKEKGDILEVTVSSAVTMLLQSELFSNEEQAEKAVLESIENGKALAKFNEWIAYQGGDTKLISSNEFFKPKYKVEVTAPSDGYVFINSALIVGEVASSLGASRVTKDDEIDFDAGIYINKKSNEEVKKGDILATLYASEKEIDLALKDKLLKAFEIRDSKTKIKNIIRKLG